VGLHPLENARLLTAHGHATTLICSFVPPPFDGLLPQNGVGSSRTRQWGKVANCKRQAERRKRNRRDRGPIAAWWTLRSETRYQRGETLQNLTAKLIVPRRT